MRFQVPQFIEVESKIFGPLTLKQFVYLVGGAGIIFLLYVVLPFWLMIFFAIPVGAFSLALAFYKVNKQPFIKIVENALNYSSSSKVYIWKKLEKKPKKKKEQKERESGDELYVPQLTKSKLKDLAWSLNIKEKIK